MRTFIRQSLVVLLALVGLAVGAVAADTNAFLEAVAKAENPVSGKEYYARHCFMYENGTHITTNYWRGTLVPINSRIKVEACTGTTLLLRVVETGESVTVENVSKYTKCDLRTIARRMLSTKPVELDGFDKEMVAAIKSGTLRKGMTKEQVLMARGFPPAHKTPVLSGDRWLFWSSRLVFGTFVFAEGKLVEGRGLD